MGRTMEGQSRPFTCCLLTLNLSHFSLLPSVAPCLLCLSFRAGWSPEEAEEVFLGCQHCSLGPSLPKSGGPGGL